MHGRRLQWVLAAVALASTAAANAAIIDNFDTQPDPNITGVFNGTASYANVAGDNQLTLTESASNKDSGFTWGTSSGTRIAIGPDVDLITITSVGPASAGSMWNCVIDFSNALSGGTTLAQPTATGDTTALVKSFKVSDVLAATPAAAGATYFDLKLRTQPYSTAGYAWTYTSITATAVPEPASLGALGLLGLGLVNRRRAAR